MDCKYCHKPAGFLRSYHNECKTIHSDAVKHFPLEIYDFIREGKLYDDLLPVLEQHKCESFLNEDESKDAVLSAINLWSKDSVNDFEPFLTFVRSLPDDLRCRVNNSADVVALWNNALPASISNEVRHDSIDVDTIGKIRSLASEVGLGEAVINNAIGNEFKRRLESILADGIIDDEEEQSLSDFIKATGFDPNSLPSPNETYHSFIQALILKDFSKEGESHRLDLTQSSILMSKGEYPIWAYNGVEAYQDKTGKQYVGGNNGVSFKICKGVYYRTGASKGHSVDYNYTESLGRGSLVITNKAIYFVGTKTIKIIINKIITLEPYSDGIKIQKDGVRNNAFTFVGFDSWFLMNLLPMLNN